MDYWYIWYEIFEDGKSVGRGRYAMPYKYKSNAVRRAKQMWSGELYNPMTGTLIERIWIVSQTDPWGDAYIFKTRAEAENFINSIKRIADWYGLVTCKDANELVGGKALNYIDSRFGWLEDQLKGLHVQESACVFVVEFPKALPIVD